MTFPVPMIEAGITGLMSSGALITGVLWWFDRKDKRRIEAEAIRERDRERKREAEEQERAKQRERDQVWFQRADEGYEKLEEKCKECWDHLEALRLRFYKLIGALDDMCDSSQTGVVQLSELRSAVRIARQEP